jgi:hypothetical protein
MGRKALFYAFTAHIQQELFDSFRLNLEQVPEPTVLFEKARAAERTLEQRAEVVHYARDRCRPFKCQAMHRFPRPRSVRRRHPHKSSQRGGSTAHGSPRLSDLRRR